MKIKAGEQELQGILGKALSRGGDFAELFFEEQDETIISNKTGVPGGVMTKQLRGVGLYLLRGMQSIYLYSNDSGLQSLSRLAAQASEMMALLGKETGISAQALKRVKLPSPNVIKFYPSVIAHKDRIAVVDKVWKAAQSSGAPLLAADITYFDTDRRITIANSEGLLTDDRRVTSRFRMSVTCGDDDGSFYHWADFTRPAGFEVFREDESYLEFARNLVLRVERMRKAEPIETGSYACSPCRRKLRYSLA